MRLLCYTTANELTITEDLVDAIPPYIILSHTWGSDADEVKFSDLQHQRLARAKPGYAKIEFCAQQAKKDGVEHFWVDTCCINKANLTELAEAITSMFQWYRKAVKCYVYLADVSSNQQDHTTQTPKSSLSTSRWFTRGWTLQELLAPEIVEFYSREGTFLGTKMTLVQTINEITGVSIPALKGAPLSGFPVDEKMRWAARRETKKKEDKAYCLFGIFGVFLPLIYGEGENAFYRLQEEIRRQFGTSESSIHTHWCVPRSRNPIFTGRQLLLQELEVAVRHAVNNSWAETQCRIVVSGIGGQGKSETCLQLAHRLRHLFWAVIWVDVSTPSIAENSFLDAARRLSIPSQTWEDARFGIANLKHPWLMVLDNADDDIDYLDYFPDGPLGVVLMTSRNEECHQYATTAPIVLPGLEEKDALELLLRASRVPHDQYESLKVDASVVARLLQSHALALVQAGAYISRGHCTFSQYPRAYEERRKQLLTFRPIQARSRYRDVYTTFEVSAEVLKATQTLTARDALQLLHLLAVCAPNRFPLFLFEAAWRKAQDMLKGTNNHVEDNGHNHLTTWHISQLPPFLDTLNTRWDPSRLTEAVSVLKLFSLISLTDHDGSSFVSMHPLVHAWANERQNKDEVQHSQLQMSCTFAVALHAQALSPAHLRLLQAHVETLAECVSIKLLAISQQNLIVPVLVRLGWTLLEPHADKKAYAMVQTTFEYLRLDSSQVDVSLTGLYRLAASTFMRNNRFQEGLGLYKQVVEIEERTLAENDPERIESQQELGVAYRMNGQAEEAMAILERVVDIRERTQDENHPERLRSQHELGAAYRITGQMEKALALLENVVRIEQRTLAEDDPDRLASQQELGVTYRLDGQLEESVSILERVVKVREHTLAEDDQRRLNSQLELSFAYMDNGQYNEAIAKLEHAVEIQGRTLDEDHPARLVCQHELAICYCRLGDYKSSLQVLDHVVAVRKRTLAGDDPELRNSELWLRHVQQSLTTAS